MLDAVAAATRETDVVGWLEPGKEVGVILTDTRASQMPIARNLETRIRTELSKRLSQAAAHRLSIRFQVYPNRDCAAGSAVVFDGTSAAGKCAKPYDAMKRRLDALGSATLLALLSPVFLVIAALIKLTSRGPVFYRQVRVGYMANPFTMLKFRTMRVDADHALHQEFVTNFIKSTGAVNSDKDKFFKITNDPRVTPVGRFLRKTSLDELPQLWNVVRGDMSLVGPRPPLPYEVAEYQAWHRRRLTDARPGITGLWQVTGRSRTTFEEMVRLDLQYARTRSLTMDLKILLATPAAVVGGKGAC